jgi:hypothetical protein
LPKCIDYTGVKSSHSANKKIKFWIQQRSKGPTEGTSGLAHRTVRCATGQCPVCHRTVSGAPPDMSGAPEDTNANSPHSGISRGDSAIIHRTVRCTPDSVRCAKGERPQELASFGKTPTASPLKFTGLSGVHRTVRCDSGATAISAPTALCRAFNARSARAEVRRAHTGTPDSKQYVSGVHRTPRRAHKTEAPTVRIQRQ